VPNKTISGALKSKSKEKLKGLISEKGWERNETNTHGKHVKKAKRMEVMKKESLGGKRQKKTPVKRCHVKYETKQ